MIVGIDTEWKKLGKGNRHLTTLIQICVSTHCLIVQALHATDGQIPEDLKKFLEEEEHIFCGAAIDHDIR